MGPVQGKRVRITWPRLVGEPGQPVPGEVGGSSFAYAFLSAGSAGLPFTAVTGASGPRPPQATRPRSGSISERLEACPVGLLMRKPFCSRLWKPGLGGHTARWPWAPQSTARPRPFNVHSGHNCSLFKAPLLPNQEILKESCLSLPESTLTEKEGEGAGKQAPELSELLERRGHPSPRRAGHTHTRSQAQVCTQVCTLIAHPLSHARTQTYARTHTHWPPTRTQTQRCTHTQAPTSSHVPACTHSQSHVCTQTHAHTGLPAPRSHWEAQNCLSRALMHARRHGPTYAHTLLCQPVAFTLLGALCCRHHPHSTPEPTPGTPRSLRPRLGPQTSNPVLSSGPDAAQVVLVPLEDRDWEEERQSLTSLSLARTGPGLEVPVALLWG